MTAETHLLEMLGHGAPMLEVLNELCNFLDAQLPGAISTVFLLDNDGIRLRPVAGPNARGIWKEEIDNLEEGPYEGFCSAAEGQRKALTVGDINSDPMFVVHREAALREGLQMASFNDREPDSGCAGPLLPAARYVAQAGRGNDRACGASGGDRDRMLPQRARIA